MDTIELTRASRRDFLRLSGGLLLTPLTLSGLLTACGGDDVDEMPSGVGASSGDATMAASPTAGSEESSPQRGGTLRVALTGDPPSLDVHQTTDSIVVLIASHLCETLFTWDADYRPVPLLAAAHEVSEDGLLHTLTLRQGVTFHNGAEMQSADVIASIQRWATISGLGAGLIEATDEIVEIDTSVIEFRMNAPFGTFAMALSRQLQGCAIYPKSVLDASTETDLAEVVGTGPYRLVEWKPSQHILAERYEGYMASEGEPDGYSGRKEQHLDAIQFVPVPNEASRIAGLRAADYAYVETISPDQLPALEDSDDLTVETLPADSWLNIVLNLRSPILTDRRVRRAIQVALDHDAIMLAAYGEGYYELTPELVPGAPTWYSDAGSEYFNQNNPDEARRLLKEVSYGGEPLRIMMTQEVQQEYNATLTTKQQLEEVGFIVDLQVYDGATLSDKRDDETAWEMYTASASFRPDPVMRNLTVSATGWWENDEKDRLLAELQAESDYDKRFAMWEEVQAKFYEDVPRLKIGNILRVLVWSSSLHNIGPTELQPEFSNAWVDR